MSKTITILWDKASGNKHTQNVTLVLTPDPRSSFPERWFESYVDYPREFKSLYSEAKKLSSTWCTTAPFDRARLRGVTLLESFEHNVLSCWVQILRDRLLVANLFAREKPQVIELSGVAIDYERMFACEFDPGLFEYTVALLASKQGIMVRRRHNSAIKHYESPMFTIRLLIGSLFGYGKAWLQKQPIIKHHEKLLLVTPHVQARLTSHFIGQALQRGYTFLSIAPYRMPNDLTIYDLAGRYVTPWDCLLAARRVWKAMQSISQLEWDNTFSVDGDSYGPMMREVLMNGVGKRAWHESYKIALLSEVIKRHKPDAMLVLYDHGIYAAAAVQHLKTLGVRTITLQHGLFLRLIPTTFPIMSDIYAAWGEYERQILIEQGADPETIVTVGSLFFDANNQTNTQHHSSNALPEVRKVLFVTQAVQSSVEWYFGYPPTVLLIQQLSALVHDRNDFSFTIRLHPNEQLPPEEQQRAEAAGISITKGVSLMQQINEHDVVVTQYSSTGVEALLAGKPLVSVNWVGETEIIPYAQEGVAEYSRSAADLLETIDRAIITNAQKKQEIQTFLNNHVCTQGAAERFFELIEK